MAVKTSWSSGDVLTAADLTDTFAAKAATSAIKVYQTASARNTGAFSTSSTSFVDWTSVTVTLTPDSSGSKFLVRAVANGKQNSSGPTIHIALVRGSTVVAESAVASPGNQFAMCVVSEVLDAPATASAVTYKLQVKVNGGTMTAINSGAVITVMEVAP